MRKGGEGERRGGMLECMVWGGWVFFSSERSM